MYNVRIFDAKKNIYNLCVWIAFILFYLQKNKNKIKIQIWWAHWAIIIMIMIKKNNDKAQPLNAIFILWIAAFIKTMDVLLCCCSFYLTYIKQVNIFLFFFIFFKLIFIVFLMSLNELISILFTYIICFVLFCSECLFLDRLIHFYRERLSSVYI